MKKLLFLLVFLTLTKANAQKIAIQKWLKPRGFSYSFKITQQEKPFKGGYFKSFYYVPVTTNPLRLDISTDSKTVYQVQLTNKKGVVFETYIFRPDTTILLPAAGKDTINLFFITAVPARGSVQVKYALVDVDTTTLMLSSKPKTAFEQIINATQTNFTTLVPNKNNRTFDYRFEKFGFAPLWTRISDNKFSQSIGTGFTADQAVADLKKWAKQMEDWLKPYGPIESTFYSTDDLKQKNVIGVVQRHEIIKKNAKGLVLFKILLETFQEENYYNVAAITAY